MRPILAALLAAAVLGGCLGGAPAAVESPVTPPPVVVTDPRDFSALGNASGAHLHDYWGGKERLTVMEEATETGGLLFGDLLRYTFRPPAGSVVPQGTARVEVTFGWSGSPLDAHGQPELWVKSARDREAVRLGPVEQGQSLTVESANEMNDLPHQSVSAWEFVFALPRPGPAQPIHFQGTVTILVDAVRGLDIPLYPAHPDRWGGATEIALFEETRERVVFDGDLETGYRCYGGCPGRHAPADGIVVPFDAAVVEVVLDDRAAAGARLGLKFHGADSREFVPLTPESEDGGRRVYRILVERGTGDGPYAQQSLWEFIPFIEAPSEDAAYAGGYAIEARVLKTA